MRASIRHGPAAAARGVERLRRPPRAPRTRRCRPPGPGNAGGDRLLRERRARRSARRPGTEMAQPLLTISEHHRQRARSGQIERLVEGALRSAAVADVGERAARLPAHLERHGGAGRMQRLGGDGHAPGKVVARRRQSRCRAHRRPSRAGSPVMRHAAPQLRAELAVHGREHVLGPHRRADADVRGLVPEARAGRCRAVRCAAGSPPWRRRRARGSSRGTCARPRPASPAKSGSGATSRPGGSRICR